MDNMLRWLRGKFMGASGTRRDHRLLLLNEMPKGAVCAEIGAWKGDFSALIWSMTSPRELHLIDPWMFRSDFPERMYGGSVAKNQIDMDRIYESVDSRFRRNSNVVLHRGGAETVLQEFKDGYFDWVYIDGDHSYESVLQDLRLCLRKVRHGGIISGDDYTWGKKDGCPVKKAVQSFIEENNIKRNLMIIRSQFIIRV